jgi:hypothetical protein
VTDHILAYVLPAAFALLPPAMQSIEASALLLAIGLQESRFLHRVQVVGPARGFWQFEVGGVEGVLLHERTQLTIAAVLGSLRYDHLAPPSMIQQALAHNDTLAACFARCLLWTSPLPIPGPNGAELGWQLYRDCWRPGQPRHETWTANFSIGWGAVLHGRQIPPTLEA